MTISYKVLETCHDFLQNAYRERLGIEFSGSIAQIARGRQPVWRIVSDTDLTTEQKPATSGCAGLLLDPEIGLLSYILLFHPNTSLHKQIVRALSLRSQLSTERSYSVSPTDKSDSRGAWRVVAYWLVDVNDKSKWIDQIREVRRETAFSEELSLDAIFLTDDSVKVQIEKHGFPRLLLTTREVLKKQRNEEMTQWLSANKVVKNALLDFAAYFHNPEQRDLANAIVRAVQEFRPGSNITNDTNQAPVSPQTIRRIRIRNFRNLRDVGFDFGGQPVSASVVHGPNGTGKTSLCEAISVALFQSSFRYKWFANRSTEKDVAATDRAREYLERYLSPVEDAGTGPTIALDDQAFARPHLVNADKTEEADLAMSGTILTQEATLEFTRMSAYELGAHVLRGYSDLADHIEQFTESRLNQANVERQSFLRGLGLSASITRVDTAYERIAGREINQSLPSFPNVLVAWFELAGRITGDAGSSLLQRWRAWGSDASRGQLAREIVGSINDRDKLMRDIREWLEQFNELALASGEVLKSTEAKVAPIRYEIEHAASRITAWGEWLEKRARVPEVAISPEADSLAKTIRDLQMRQRLLLEKGLSTSSHYEHLIQAETYVRETWSKLHSNDCPTCATDHSMHGGILKVVESLRAKTAAEREELRGEYNKLKIQIDQTQKQLTELGQAECPVNIEEQSNLTESLQWLVPGTASLSEWIIVRTQRDTLLGSMASLRQVPSVPPSVNAEIEAERFAQRVLLQFQEANRTFHTPANWKPVKDKLTETLAGIVNEHLPNTLSRLWCELALNLTAAPWLLPDRPSIGVTTRRGDQTATLLVKDRLARYILNQAEAHTLGLAWFFTRYLIRGRFFHACMVMDDPAHELDQTSFRDLCRLWETMMRVHRVYDRPLKLIVMLNQESRALEAARATGGLLAVLGWSRGQEKEKAISTISVIGEGFHAPQPASLFEKTGT